MGFLKDLFIVNEDKEKEKAAQQQSDATPQPQLSVKQPSAQPTIQPQQTVSQPYVYVPPTNTVASPGGNVSQEILKMISDVIEQHNMDGNDYYELNKIVESQDFKNAIPDKSSRIVAAFHTLKAQDVNFTKQRLIESIDYYKQAVNNEYQNVLNAYNEQIEDKINNPKRQIDSLLERKAELMQQLVELDDKVKSIEAEIAQNSAELSSKRADYEVTFSVVLNKLETEKQQLNSILQ